METVYIVGIVAAVVIVGAVWLLAFLTFPKTLS